MNSEQHVPNLVRNRFIIDDAKILWLSPSAIFFDGASENWPNGSEPNALTDRWLVLIASLWKRSDPLVIWV